MKPFKGTVQIGKTYMDTWGRLHDIQGHVVLRRGWKASGEDDTLDKNLVWSTGGWHFNIKTGLGTHGTHQLVQLPPAEEKQFWIEALAQFRRVNSEDKLKLIKEELDRIEERIAAL